MDFPGGANDVNATTSHNNGVPGFVPFGHSDLYCRA